MPFPYFDPDADPPPVATDAATAYTRGFYSARENRPQEPGADIPPGYREAFEAGYYDGNHTPLNEGPHTWEAGFTTNVSILPADYWRPA